MRMFYRARADIWRCPIERATLGSALAGGPDRSRDVQAARETMQSHALARGLVTVRRGEGASLGEMTARDEAESEERMSCAFFVHFPPAPEKLIIRKRGNFKVIVDRQRSPYRLQYIPDCLFCFFLVSLFFHLVSISNSMHTPGSTVAWPEEIACNPGSLCGPGPRNHQLPVT